MLIFADSADLFELSNLSDMGLISGVTTNPNLLKESAFETSLKINEFTGHQVSYQPKDCLNSDFINEVKRVYEHQDRLILKVPPKIECFEILSPFIDKGLDVNVTLVFTLNQAILAGQLGAKYVSVFVGRLEDYGVDPFELITNIRELYEINNIDTEIIAASIRNCIHAEKAAIAGAHISTISPKIIKEMFDHELTEKGIIDFSKEVTKKDVVDFAK